MPESSTIRDWTLLRNDKKYADTNLQLWPVEVIVKSCSLAQAERVADCLGWHTYGSNSSYFYVKEMNECEAEAVLALFRQKLGHSRTCLVHGQLLACDCGRDKVLDRLEKLLSKLKDS